MCNLLHVHLGWSMWHATWAAQKLPTDWEDQCERSFFCKVHAIKEFDIPAVLYINSDQMQVIYAPGNHMMWAPIGAKQVSLVGADEKCTFTLMTSVAANGTILPFQAIYSRLTKASLSTLGSLQKDLDKEGFCIKFSGTRTYWSNQSTMCNFIIYILTPYFDCIRSDLNLNILQSQKALWQINVWSVHRSEEFCTWMKKFHPLIILDYMPGGCTGVHQSCDVGI